MIKAYIPTTDGQIHYRHVPGEGMPVLFFHRTPVWSSSFDRVLALLEGWRPLYAFDTPGFGESFTPAPGATITDYRDWFIAAIDGLGIDQFHLCGHHTGGHFAIEIAAQLPDRCRSLMIDGAMYHTAAERGKARAGWSAAPSIDPQGHYIGQIWGVLQSYYPTFVAETIHQELVGALRSLTTRDTCVSALLDHDVPAALARVVCPIHASAAQDDVFVDMLPRIAAGHANATVSIYGAAGIASPELQTEAFANVLRSLVESV